jgi:hypothetical protein
MVRSPSKGKLAMFKAVWLPTLTSNPIDTICHVLSSWRAQLSFFMGACPKVSFSAAKPGVSHGISGVVGLIPPYAPPDTLKTDHF